MPINMPTPVREAQRTDADDFLERLAQAEVGDLTVTFSYRQAMITVPAVLIRFVVLSVFFQLDRPKRWRVALERGWVPQAVLDWLGVRGLADVAEATRVGWVPATLFVDRVAERVGVVLMGVRQPRAEAVVRRTLRRLLFHKDCVQDGGLRMGARYWKRFLRDAGKPLRDGLCEEVRERIAFALGQLELAELAPRRWLPMPELEEEERGILQAAMVEPAPEKLEALREAFEAGLFDFIADLLATTYSLHGRRAYSPVLMWKVSLAMMAVGEMDPGPFLRRVNDSIQLRLFLGVMSTADLPSPRRIKGFLAERMAPAAEHLVLWFNVELLTEGSATMGNEFGTDGMDMTAQARTKSDAVRTHLRPHIEWLLGELRNYLQQQGRTELTDAEHDALLDAIRQLDGAGLGSAKRSKAAIVSAVRNALAVQPMTPRSGAPPSSSDSRAGPAPPAFGALAAVLAAELGRRIAAFGDHFSFDTLHDPQSGARTKYGKTLHGFGMQFVIDLSYGFVWAFAVFPANESFQPRIADFMLAFQARHDLGPIKFTSDREFTIGAAIHRWHQAHIEHYGPQPANPARSKGIFTEDDFHIHSRHAECPDGKTLRRQPSMKIRGAHHEWRYRAAKTDCRDCPLRAQCTTGRGPRVLSVNAYRNDLVRHAARMAADPAHTRDLMARHRSLVEGAVNNLKNHQGAQHALWKGLAMAHVQFALAIVMVNLLKRHKIQHGLLEDLKAKRARSAPR